MASKRSYPHSPVPRSREIWYVKDLWEDKAQFTPCLEAEKRFCRLDEHDGFACVPYKSRPAIVLGPADDCEGDAQRFMVALLSGKEGARRVALGNLEGLDGKNYLFLQAPTFLRKNFFGTRKGTVDRVCYQCVVKTTEKAMTRAPSAPANEIAFSSKFGDVLGGDEDL